MPDSSFINTLCDALGNSDDQTPDEIREELREEGVDVDSMEKRLKELQVKLEIEGIALP